MKIEQWSIEKVKPYERNPRKNEGAVDAVASSIREFGFRVPIVVDGKGVVIAGHTRLKAALKLGLAKVPVHVAADLTPAQVKALRIADNKLHELASWDADALRLELAEVLGSGFDMGILGFGDGLAEAMAEAHVGIGDPDHVPEPPDKATSKRGDVWILGDHRLLCGDSSKPEDLDRLLDGEKIHLVNTDPPYNVKAEPRSNNAIAAGNSSFQATRLAHGASRPRGKMRAKDRPLANDFVSDSAFDGLLAAWFGNLSRVMIPGGGFYIWGGYLNCDNYPPVMRACGLRFSQAIIWVKGHPVMTRKDFMGNHEWCFYGWKEGAGHRWFGPRNVIDVWRCSPSLDFAASEVSSGARIAVECEGKSIGISAAEKTDRAVKIQGGGAAIVSVLEGPTDVWEIKKISPQSMVHLTEKPVELAARAMRYSSKRGENVLDLFGGSGSTLIAAEMNGRRAFLLELDELYCDVIVARWEKFTGKKARRILSKAAKSDPKNAPIPPSVGLSKPAKAAASPLARKPAGRRRVANAA